MSRANSCRRRGLWRRRRREHIVGSMTRRRCVAGRARRAKSRLCLLSSGMTEDGRGMSVVPARIRSCVVQPMATSKATQDGAKSCSDGSFSRLISARSCARNRRDHHALPPTAPSTVRVHPPPLLLPTIPAAERDLSPHPLAQRHPGLAQRGENSPEARIIDAIGA